MSALDDDIEAALYQWVPAISHHFPGAGIGPLTVYDVTYDWWRVYVGQVEAIVAEAKKQT